MYLEELKKIINGKRSISDVILGILSFSQKDIFPRKIELFYILLNQAQKKSKIKEIKDLVFDESPIIPYSDQIDSAFFQLELGVLNYFRFNNETYFELKNSKEIRKKSFEKFNKKEQQELANLFDILNELIKEPLATPNFEILSPKDFVPLFLATLATVPTVLESSTQKFLTNAYVPHEYLSLIEGIITSQDNIKQFPFSHIFNVRSFFNDKEKFNYELKEQLYYYLKRNSKVAKYEIDIESICIEFDKDEITNILNSYSETTQKEMNFFCELMKKHRIKRLNDDTTIQKRYFRY